MIEAQDGSEALDLFFAQKDIALVLLDVMMPKRMAGRSAGKSGHIPVPIIMLTAKSDERDELLGFELGVDEYISKPFSPKILVARVEAILRRMGQANQKESLASGGIMLDKNARLVTIDGREVDLSYKEFELLSYFMEHKGEALSEKEYSIMCGIMIISGMPAR